MLDNLIRGRLDNLADALARGQVARRRGRHPRLAALGDGDRRRRPRLPPGGDPHHAVRRGSAPGDGGARRRHVQRRRGRAPRRRPQGRRVVVGVGLRAGRDVPDRPSATTRTTTARCTARSRCSTRACCARSTTCTACDYVALRYFNVYGPRMDIYGKYTEVLIRWMERIIAGEAAADLRRRQADDGLRLRHRHRPGQHPRRPRRRHRRGVQRRQRHRDQPQRAGRRARPR